MKRQKPRRRKRRPKDEGSYVCPSCGERIVIPVDPSGGDEQQYVEDCPVCCNPNVIHVEFMAAGELPRVWAEAE
jgi:cysteine-rich CPXCG protein